VTAKANKHILAFTALLLLLLLLLLPPPPHQPWFSSCAEPEPLRSACEKT
jgi:hypothetical protein